MKRPLRLVVTPVVLVAAAVAVVVWAHRGADVAELGVLRTGRLWVRVREHVALCAVSTALAVAVAVPAGVAATRPGLRRLAPPLLFVANVGQSVPTIAVLALAFSVTGIGFRTAVIGLWAYSLLPVLRNTVAGLAGVDPAVVEAARGMGMSPAQVLAAGGAAAGLARPRGRRPHRRRRQRRHRRPGDVRRRRRPRRPHHRRPRQPARPDPLHRRGAHRPPGPGRRLGRRRPWPSSPPPTGVPDSGQTALENAG